MAITEKLEANKLKQIASVKSGLFWIDNMESELKSKNEFTEAKERYVVNRRSYLKGEFLRLTGKEFNPEEDGIKATPIALNVTEPVKAAPKKKVAKIEPSVNPEVTEEAPEDQEQALLEPEPEEDGDKRFSHKIYSSQGREVLELTDLAEAGEMTERSEVRSYLEEVQDANTYMIIVRDTDGAFDGWDLPTGTFIRLGEDTAEKAIRKYVKKQLKK